jgi:creatinine amidohydrolase
MRVVTQTEILNRLAQDVALENKVNTLVVNWWAACTDVTLEVFGSPGGHAGENETAFVQAINPELAKRERLSAVNTIPIPGAGEWSATPFPSPIQLYRKRENVPRDFDRKKADEYFRRVNACVGTVVKETLRKWGEAGFN